MSYRFRSKYEKLEIELNLRFIGFWLFFKKFKLQNKFILIFRLFHLLQKKKKS